MYQQSVDRSGGSQKSDLILFIVLIIAFFAVGAVVMYLEKLFDSNVPRYVFIGLVLAAIYAIYRLRIIGFRYTVFYKEPETVYDPRFDDMITHEDYPYPVGTIVFERIVSAASIRVKMLRRLSTPQMFHAKKRKKLIPLCIKRAMRCTGFFSIPMKNFWTMCARSLRRPSFADSERAMSGFGIFS